MFARAEGGDATKVKPPQAYFATDFLEQMYKTTPGIKSKFSGVALHPYTSDYQKLTADIEELRAVLKENHDAGKGLWITELGWSSQPPAGPTTRSPRARRARSKQLKGAFKLLRAQPGANGGCKRIYWFSVDDQPGSLQLLRRLRPLRRRLRAEESWFAYVKFAGGTPG